MAELFNAYIRLKVRKVIAEKDIPVDRALDFLEENPEYGVIARANKEFTKEELLNVKDLGPELGDGPYYSVGTGKKISESTYRELFETTGYNPKSGPERDN